MLPYAYLPMLTHLVCHHMLWFRVDAVNATLPLHTYAAAFPVVVSALAQGDWWDLASLYRTWALSHAEWMRVGPLATRTDLPAWLEGITLWMNNNWGPDPLGPNYGGTLRTQMYYRYILNESC